MACTAVVEQARQDVCPCGAYHALHRVEGLGGRERCVVVVGNGVVGIAGIIYLAVCVGILVVGGIAGEELAGTVDEAVAAFPFEGGGVVGESHLARNRVGQQVVAGASVIVEVQHGYAVLAAVVEANGAAVAIPEGVGVVLDEAVVGQGLALADHHLFHGRGVAEVPHRDPHLAAVLYGVDEVDEDALEVAFLLEIFDVLLYGRGVSRVHRVVQQGCVVGYLAGIVCRVGNSHHSAPASVLPSGVAVLVPCTLARQVYVGLVVIVAHMVVWVGSVGHGDDHCLQLLPFAREPAVGGHLGRPRGVAGGFHTLGGGQVDGGGAIANELAGISFRGLAHALRFLHLGARGEFLEVFGAELCVVLSHGAKAQQSCHGYDKCFFHLYVVVNVS